MKKLIICLILLKVIFVRAQNYPTSKIGFNSEEDLSPFPLLFTESEDRNYTLGQSFNYSGISLNKCFESCFGKVISHKDNNSKKLFFNNHDSAIYVPLSSGISLFGTGFTPDNLRDTGIIKNDRPYGFIIGLNFLIASIDTSYTKYVERDYNIGLIGNNIGKNLQTAIHVSQNENDTKNPHTPRGWKHQISNSKIGMPTFLFSSKRQWLLNGKKTRIWENQTHAHGLEIRAGYKYYVGYYTGFEGLLGFRFGRFDPRNWFSDFSSLSLANMLVYNQHNKYLFQEFRSSELYLLLDIKPTCILYNSFLEGQMYYQKGSDNKFTSNQINNFILQWQSGLGLSIKMCEHRSLQIAWTFFNGRSPEFKATKRWHTWGGVVVYYIF